MGSTTSQSHAARRRRRAEETRRREQEEVRRREREERAKAEADHREETGRLRKKVVSSFILVAVLASIAFSLNLIGPRPIATQTNLTILSQTGTTRVELRPDEGEMALICGCMSPDASAWFGYSVPASAVDISAQDLEGGKAQTTWALRINATLQDDDAWNDAGSLDMPVTVSSEGGGGKTVLFQNRAVTRKDDGMTVYSSQKMVNAIAIVGSSDVTVEVFGEPNFSLKPADGSAETFQSDSPARSFQSSNLALESTVPRQDVVKVDQIGRRSPQLNVQGRTRVTFVAGPDSRLYLNQKELVPAPNDLISLDFPAVLPLRLIPSVLTPESAVRAAAGTSPSVKIPRITFQDDVQYPKTPPRGLAFDGAQIPAAKYSMSFSVASAQEWTDYVGLITPKRAEDTSSPPISTQRAIDVYGRIIDLTGDGFVGSTATGSQSANIAAKDDLHVRPGGTADLRGSGKPILKISTGGEDVSNLISGNMLVQLNDKYTATEDRVPNWILGTLLFLVAAFFTLAVEGLFERWVTSSRR